MSDWADDFKPVLDPKRHRWRIVDGAHPADVTAGYEAQCDRCGLRVVGMVDVALALRPMAYVSGRTIGGVVHTFSPARREPYNDGRHGRCEGGR